MNNRSGNATIILLIIALVVGIASIILIITVSRSNPKTSTSAAAPILLPKTATSSATPNSSETTTPTPAAGPTTVTSTTPVSTAGTITTQTALSTNRTSLAVDFITPSFSGINTITYSISYTADASGSATTKNIQGSFSPASVLVTGYTTSGSPYIRKYFTLGTCSGSVCTYDVNPRSFTVTATPS